MPYDESETNYAKRKPIHPRFFPSTTRLDSEPGILFVRDPLQTPNFIDIKIANNRPILPSKYHLTRALTVSPHTKEIIEKRYVH